jgi:hypothetical protein
MAAIPPKRKRKSRAALPEIIDLPPDHKIKPGVSLTHQKLIGRTIIQWNCLEHEMQDFVWRMLGLNFSDGRLLTRRMDANYLIQLLGTLAPHRLKEPFVNEFLDLLVDADALRDDRNHICHGIWGTLVPLNVPVASSFKGTDEPDTFITQTFPYERMIEIIQGIKAVRRSMNRLMDEHFPSPKTFA